MKSHQLVRCALFAALTAAGAFLRIPVGPLLYTMQLLFTMLSGLLLGAKCGALSQVLYVALGLAGLPVFGGGGGVTYLLQPTCGFVLALPLCAWLVGRLGSRRRAVPACLAGLAAVYAAGLLYLAMILRFSLGQPIGFSALLSSFLLPYLPGDALKILACAMLCRRLPASLFPDEKNR